MQPAEDAGTAGRKPIGSGARNEAIAERYRVEFDRLGAGRVRDELRQKRWPKDKLAVARQWLDRQDVGVWMERHPGAARKKVRSKWLMYVLVAGAAVFGVVRVLRMMGHF